MRVKPVCDDQGRWWAVGEVTGDALGGPFETEDEVWEWIDRLPDEQDDGRDYTPPYEP